MMTPICQAISWGARLRRPSGRDEIDEFDEIDKIDKPMAQA